MSIKQKLLTPAPKPPVELQLLRETFLVRRLSAQLLAHYNQEFVKARTSDDSDAAVQASASLVLDSIIDEDGRPLSDSVSPDEIIKIYDHEDLKDAVDKLMSFNFMGVTSEADAKKD
ncbi:hypothetical protein [Vibrio cincinnatiensis]|uniref:hypothetical protein n=1 Tax=Vibrio cincinnatiensis TaxID=675 RepID=UPI001EE0923B|nr:hypothetical protein [Vibrio cincinnatiensis]MCG3726319.1 hypothetical protein [Vibrio cincinnatiensis]